MPKNVFCSKCKTQLQLTPTAIKSLGVIVYYVAPHDCGETTNVDPVIKQPEPISEPKEPEQVPLPPSLETMFKGFEHISNPSKNIQDQDEMYDPGDRRPSSQVKSTAPDSVLNKVKNGLPGPVSPKDLSGMEGD